ncbi:MAG: hypothetical protein CMK72_13595 [Pseudomonadaceae bacterium]|nr:hypothetical protein [Pseudomonadaceae bacterium]HCP56889.1 hypothetical protein [Pseudomonas sp.]|tara:strand:- start:234 stop:437 length:204 start_codon:yes stop_codon:yes gene_type:complete
MTVGESDQQRQNGGCALTVRRTSASPWLKATTGLLSNGHNAPCWPAVQTPIAGVKRKKRRINQTQIA